MHRTSSPQFALAVLLAINVMNFYDRAVLGAVAEEVRKEWQLSDTMLGLLNTAFTLLYAVVGVPLGRWSDRGSRVGILSAGVALWSVLTALSGLARSFAELFVVRLGVGVGEAACAPAASSLIGDLYPAVRRAKAMSVFMLGLPIGLALSFFVSGWMVTHYGWRETFFVAGIPGLVCAAAALFIAEPPRGTKESRPQTEDDVQPFQQILSIPAFWWIVVSGAIYNFCVYAIGAFLVAYLRRFHAQGAWEANLVATISYGLSGIPGLVLGGYVSDWAFRKRREGRLQFGTVAMLASAPLWLVALAQPSKAVLPFGVLVFLGCLPMYTYYSAVYATIQDIVQPRLRATAMAIYFCAMYFLGASLGPWVIGGISDFCTARAAAASGICEFTQVALEPFRGQGLRTAMLLIPGLLAVLGVVLLAAARSLRKDAGRARG